jgi:alkylation response protein AidB-like acyl-CoA dehydrogenase
MIIDLSAPGVTVRPITLLTGEQHFNEVHLDEVFVPDEMVFGEIGNGWSQVNSELAYERSGPERYLSTVQLILEFVELAGQTQDARSLTALGSLFAQMHSIRDLSVQVALALDDDIAQDKNAALVKDLGTRFEQDSVELVRSVLDARVTPPRLQELLWQATCSAPTFTLRGGTTEVLRVIVSRGLASMISLDSDPVTDNLRRLLEEGERSGGFSAGHAG